MLDGLPEDLADALGLVIAEQQERSEREHAVFSSEMRAQLAEHHSIIVEQRSRIKELEAALERAVDDQIKRVDVALAGLKDGKDGLDAAPVDMAQVERLITAKVGEQVGAAFVTLPIPKAAKDLGELVAAAVADGLAGIHAPRDGKDGVDGKDAEPVDYDVVCRWIDEKVAGLPRPRDVAGAVIDRSGCLMLTLTDGSVKELGPVVGKDADPALIEAMVRDHISRIPAPKDGRDGKDGRNGQDADLAIIEHAVSRVIGAAASTGADDVPDGLIDMVANGAKLLAEAPAIIKDAASHPSIVLNIASPSDAERRTVSKKITTRKDESGNLIADVVEQADGN